MIKKNLIIATIVIIVLVSLSLYDFFSIRHQAQVSGPTLQPEIVLKSAPADAKTNQDLKFTWRINSATPRLTQNTALYWSETSSPSALTTSDSPEVVGYSNHTSDFVDGDFTLPSDFSTSIIVGRPARIFYRFYANVDKLHLWTKEYSLTVH